MEVIKKTRTILLAENEEPILSTLSFILKREAYQVITTNNGEQSRETMGQKIIGIGEYMVSYAQTDILKTYTLGSCVAVMIYDYRLKIAGMCHFALPSSEIDPQRALDKPAYYVDTGMPLLLETLIKLGCEKRNIWVKIAGYLNSCYYEAEDGIIAISLLENQKVDLIVTDLRMPKMDGSTFIKKLKIQTATKDIPVIVVSSMKNDPLTIQLLEEGVLGIIKKPISPEKAILITGGRNNEL